MPAADTGWQMPKQQPSPGGANGDESNGQRTGGERPVVIGIQVKKYLLCIELGGLPDFFDRFSGLLGRPRLSVRIARQNLQEKSNLIRQGRSLRGPGQAWRPQKLNRLFESAAFWHRRSAGFGEAGLLGVGTVREITFAAVTVASTIAIAVSSRLRIEFCHHRADDMGAGKLQAAQRFA